MSELDDLLSSPSRASLLDEFMLFSIAAAVIVGLPLLLLFVIALIY